MRAFHSSLASQTARMVVALAVLGWWPGVVGGPRIGAAQVPCTDTDGDGVCDDVDNCPLTANADQADTFGSPAGDACERQMVVAKAKLRTGTVASPKGKMSARGTFIVQTGGFQPTANVAIHMTDGNGTEVNAPAQDGANPDGTLCNSTVPVRVKCRNSSPTLSAVAVFKLGPPDALGAQLVSWSVKLAKLATNQIVDGPITVDVTDVAQGIVYDDSIFDCRVSNGKLTCKEY